MIEVKKQSHAEMLREIDAKIAEVSGMASYLIEQGATLGRIEDEIAFLRVLWRRRETVLNEYRKDGGEVADLYTHRERAV